MEQVAADLGFQPILPTREQLTPSNLDVSYDVDSDYLYVYIKGFSRAATSVELNQFVYLRVDRLTQQAVGLQIEHYSIAVKADPSLLVLADLANIDRATFLTLGEFESINVFDREDRAAVDRIFEEFELAAA